MAELPNISVWADDLFDADPIGTSQFEAGLSQCDWTPDLLNGALYMQSKWMSEIVKCMNCLDLPTLPEDDCETIKMAYAVDTAGCGKIYQYTGEPVPEGFKLITESISGTADKVVDGNPEFSAADINFPTATWEFYQIFKGTRTFTTSKHCQLKNAGIDFNILADSRVPYFLDMALPAIKEITPYQFGTAIFANGTLVARNGDFKALNQSGNNAEVTDLIEGTFTTDGNDLVVDVYLLLGVQTDKARITIGDMISVDQAQIGVTMSLEN